MSETPFPALEVATRKQRTAAQAHAFVAIRDRVDESVRARPRTAVELRMDDPVMAWKTSRPSKRGKWVGPGVCVGKHRG
eukprot:8280146-Alexandrium_andersonii.AAC.1